MSLKAALDTLHALELEKAEIVDNIGKLKWEIQRTMEEEGATLYENKEWKVEIKPKKEWNEDALVPLREHYSPEELEGLMNKPRPRTYNKTKLNKEVRKGGEVRRIIEFAISEGAPELTIKAKA